MKILLIVPTLSYTAAYPTFLSNADFPAGFAYLTAALKDAGHEVAGVNPNNRIGYASAEEMARTLIIEGLKTHQPDFIGLGGLCTDFSFLRDAISIIREFDKRIPIVLGGGIVTHDAKFIFETLTPDYCIIGEGEEAIVALANRISSGQPVSDILGIGYWDGAHPVFTQERKEFIDIDKLPFPDYSPFGLEEMMDDFALAARYLYRYPKAKPRLMTLVAARACPFSCTFCTHAKGNRRYRARSVANVIEEIRVNFDRTRFNILILLDELFAVNKARLREFCDAINDGRERYGWDFVWAFQTHASAALDLPALKMAKEAGCFFFSYGMESASPRVLASMNKKTRPEQLAAAIELAKQAEIGFGGNFIFGDPAETPETISETLTFYREHCTESHVYLGQIRPYPGSRLFSECIANGIIADKLKYYETIDKADFNMTTMPDKDWTHWLRRIIPALGTFALVRCVNVSAIFRDESLAGKTITEEGRKSLWHLQIHCPFCEKEYTYPELVDEATVAAQGYRILTGCPHCHKRVNVNIPVTRDNGVAIPIQPLAGNTEHGDNTATPPATNTGALPQFSPVTCLGAPNQIG